MTTENNIEEIEQKVGRFILSYATIDAALSILVLRANKIDDRAHGIRLTVDMPTQMKMKKIRVGIKHFDGLDDRWSVLIGQLDVVIRFRNWIVHGVSSFSDDGLV